MIDSIVFELDLTNIDPAVRNSIIYLWRTGEKAIIEPLKANIFNSIEYGYKKRHLTFNVNYPSSSCKIHADLDDLTNTIKFNFSIPKLLYGCNLFTSDFHYIINEELHSQYIDQKRLQNNFKIMLNTIFDIISAICFDEIPLNILLESISIYQIDICFNHCFETKEYALGYIDGLKKAQRKYSGIRNLRTFETSLMFVMSDYTLKVYHKGSEIANNKKSFDLICDNYNKNEALKIMNIADRTVRYECSLRSQKIKDLFLKTFRENCSYFQSLPDVIKNKFSTRKLKLTCHNRSKYYIETPEEEFLAMFKFGKPNQKFIPEHFFNPLFDFETFLNCVFFATEIFSELQIKNSPSSSELIAKINAFNDYAEWSGEKKVNAGNIVKIFNLCRDKTLNELVQEKIISRATKYNFLKKCKLVDIEFNENSTFNEIIQNTDPKGEIFCFEIGDFQHKLIEKTLNCENKYFNT